MNGNGPAAACLRLKQLPDLFDPFAVHPEVRIADPRRGTNMDDAMFTIEQELDIIDKSKQATTELHMPIGVTFLHKSRVAR